MNSTKDTILAIDAGNTRVKWGLFNATGSMVESGACLNSELAHANLPHALRIIISNVAGKNIEAQLKSVLPDGMVYWIEARPKACGVKNGYESPSTLGSDRWAALIAAWHLKHAACVVVNAGTAVTVDALSSQQDNTGLFMGGMILPGLNLMQHSLGIATAQLPKKTSAKRTAAKQAATSLSERNYISADHLVSIFATNTVDAVYSGALHAILGAIDLMAQALYHHAAIKPHIVISGGNAAIIHQQITQHFLTSHITNSVIIVDNLVLHGLYLLENSKQSGAL